MFPRTRSGPDRRPGPATEPERTVCDMEAPLHPADSPAGPERSEAGPIVVLGGGGHAKVLICVLKQTSCEILGYTDRQDRGLILGTPYLGDDAELENIVRRHGACRALLGVGKVDASARRLTLQEEVETLGFDFPVIVSRNAILNEDVTMERGSVAFDGVIVNSGTRVGRAAILNTNCTVEHDCRLGDNVHVAPGSTLSGGVTVGDHSMIGAGATLIEGVTVCAGCLVGAGSTVVKDLTVPGTYVGSPARRIA